MKKEKGAGSSRRLDEPPINGQQERDVWLPTELNEDCTSVENAPNILKEVVLVLTTLFL